MASFESAAIAATASRAYGPHISFGARHAKTLSIARHLSLSLLLSIALILCVEWIARNSAMEAVRFFLDPARPAWTTIGVFFLLFLAVDAIFARENFGVILLSAAGARPGTCKPPEADLSVWTRSTPTDFLFGRQIMELMPVLVRDRPWDGCRYRRRPRGGAGCPCLAHPFRLAPFSKPLPAPAPGALCRRLAAAWRILSSDGLQHVLHGCAIACRSYRSCGTRPKTIATTASPWPLH